MLPPFGVGIQYKLFNTNNPTHGGVLATYVGPATAATHLPAGWHTFQIVVSGNLVNIDTTGPLYGTQGIFVGYKGNAGGRRKSRRSKRSKRSARKSRRRHH